MSATATHPQDVAEYLERVRLALSDLPSEERDELMADVESSLLDAASDSSVPLVEQLGPPERFAGELRAAAGLAAPSGAGATAPRLARLLARVRPLAAGARDFAPAWWVLRAYVAIAAFALVTGSGWAYRAQMIPVIHSANVTALVGLAVLALSIWLGRRGFRWMLVADLALAIAVIPVAVHLVDQYRHGNAYGGTPQEIILPNTPGLAFDGRPIRNIYPYDRHGRLLQDVRLYDEAGVPLPVGATDPHGDPLRRTVRSASGRRVLNAFPIRYFEPGSRRVKHPAAAPKRHVPALRTPALRGG
ncbi:MAG: hypothetical protein JWM73_2151 [Solirubrobacterales bacterium]|nr:hypothetical protein [Solirubrobacterales bacterium]